MIYDVPFPQVVTPLLSLCLSTPDSLVVPVIPPQLLPFTRSSLRKTFTSTVGRPVLTLTITRSQSVGLSDVDRVKRGMRTGGLIVTTPSSVKSLVLKAAEGAAAAASGTDSGTDREVSLCTSFFLKKKKQRLVIFCCSRE